MESVALDAFSIRDIAPGTKSRMWFKAIPGLLEPVRLPALVARGQFEGRTLLAIAGVHGDEYEGMEAIRLFFDELDPSRMHGSFIAIPIANPFAYEARARVAPLAVDGANLARVFPGDPASSPSRALAKAILDFVESTLTPNDLLIDFHSGSADVEFASLIGFRDIPGPASVRSEEAARHFGLESFWRIPDSRGPLNAESTRRGIPTIGTETTGRAGCIGEDVDRYVEGLRGMLAFLDIIPGEKPNRLSARPLPTVSLVAPTTGFLRHRKKLHDQVAAGEELGVLINPFGEITATIVSPVTGTIWAARAMPPVWTGELMFMIARDDDS
jgi:predicted deacylase